MEFATRRSKRGGSRTPPCGAGPNPIQSTGLRASAASLTSVAIVASVAILTSAVACSSAPATEPNVAQTPRELPSEERYFPLRDGELYQYDVVGQDGRVAFLITKVGRDGSSATLTSGHRVQHLTVRSDGVYNEAGFYIVKTPLRVGTEWAGQSGVVRVVSEAQSIQTEAGNFTDCIVTKEVTQGTVELRTVESTFCANVGLVRLVVHAESDQVRQIEQATLRYYGPPIDIDAL
jgi:hypothetical protein